MRLCKHELDKALRLNHARTRLLTTKAKALLTLLSFTLGIFNYAYYVYEYAHMKVATRSNSACFTCRVRARYALSHRRCMCSSLPC